MLTLALTRNYRGVNQIDDDTYFDEVMYEQRYAVEQTNAWQDSYRTLLVRQDTSLGSWVAWHHLFCIHAWIKKLVKL